MSIQFQGFLKEVEFVIGYQPLDKDGVLILLTLILKKHFI